MLIALSSYNRLSIQDKIKKIYLISYLYLIWVISCTSAALIPRMEKFFSDAEIIIK